MGVGTTASHKGGDPDSFEKPLPIFFFNGVLPLYNVVWPGGTLFSVMVEMCPYFVNFGFLNGKCSCGIIVAPMCQNTQNIVPTLQNLQYCT